MTPATTYLVYILACADGSYYTGITVDVARRLAEHKAGTASKYTRARGAVQMVYTESCENRSKALMREAAIKRMTRAQKEALLR